MKRSHGIALLLAGALALGLAGCGDGAADGSSERPRVVATTAVAADLVRAVAGDRVRVAALIPGGADPHEYEPRPRDLEALADADVVVRSGGEIDDWLSGSLSSVGASAEPLDLGRSVAASRIEEDPHWWHDPRNADRAAQAIRDALVAADSGGRPTYDGNLARYRARLRRLDAGIARCIDGIPPARRRLVTSHDALGYYAARYGLEVVGAVIPSRSTAAQASAAATARLVETIRRDRVPTIFAESSVNRKTERAIAAEAGARVGEQLYADGLGPAGSPAATLTGALAANTRAIVAGLRGRPCRLAEA